MRMSILKFIRSVKVIDFLKLLWNKCYALNILEQFYANDDIDSRSSLKYRGRSLHLGIPSTYRNIASRSAFDVRNLALK